MYSNASGATNMANRIRRLPAVLDARGRSRSSHYKDIQKGLFTPPVAIGQRAVGWPENEIEELTAAAIAGKSEAEIKLLVRKLVAARKTK